MGANVLWGEEIDFKSYVKFEQMDMTLAVTRGGLVSDWISGDKLDWQLKVHNPATGRFTVVNKLEEEALKAKGASKLTFRLHHALDKGPRITTKLCLAPVEDISARVGSSAKNFPIIQVGKDLKLEFFPKEPEDAHFGLGFVPLYIYMDEGDITMPDFKAVRLAITDMFNDSVRAKVHKNHSTWKTSAALGMWDPVPPLYIWPSNTDIMEDDDEEGEREGCLVFECRNVCLVELKRKFQPTSAVNVSINR